MAQAGTARSLGNGARSEATRQGLVDAATATLEEEGYARASARAMAARAGCNQGLIFYHFGSVVGLLLAALDAVSATRLERYREVVGAATSPAGLIDAAAAIFREDLDAGHLTVLAEMIAGASSTPGLGVEVARRIAPWKAFAAEAIGRLLGPSLDAVVPATDLAHGIVAFYLGLEMLAHLDGDRAAASALFDRARALTPLLGVLARSDLPATGSDSGREHP